MRLAGLFFLVIFFYRPAVGQSVYNHLRNETSPYLRQHSKNPVDWYPWNSSTLNKAVLENKLIVVSIGYSTCHWCHVMEKESFSDSAVSALMNRHFLSIKVDREERPDVDRIYMDACQVVNGDACGWPLNVIALPGGKPVFTATYMDKKQWMDVLQFFADQKNTQPEKLSEYSEQLALRIKGENKLNQNLLLIQDSLFHQYTREYLATQDLDLGGLKGSPKFPLPIQHEFLLTYHLLFQDQESLHAVTTSLDQMMKGGIYDWLEGGFARYSTDEKWMLPHFEKMLYDNAQLISLYAHAYQITRKEEYKQVATSCLDFLNRFLKAPSGGYYSSFDADSEGEEGKYYLWTKSEVEHALVDPDLIELANEIFQISEEGNTLSNPNTGQLGKNVLAFLGSSEVIARTKGWSNQQVELKLNGIKKRLLIARSSRTRPALDDKIICSWNALVVTALSDAFIAFGDVEHQKQALATGEFIWKYFYQKQGNLTRIFDVNGKDSQAFLDDYAYTGLAFIKLYQLSFDEKWLYRARSLVEYTQKHFYDATQRLFYYNLDTLLGRQLDYQDQMMPSSNSSMAFLLYQLGTYFEIENYLQQANEMTTTAFGQMQESGAMSHYLNWARLHLQTNFTPPYEIAVLGKKSLNLSHQLAVRLIPNALWMGGNREGTLPLLEGKLIRGKTLIYICQNKICKLPVTKVEEAWKMIMNDE